MTDTDKKPYSFQTGDGHSFSGVGKKLHSVDDQPAVTYANGTRWWYRDGQIHRDNGPAVIHHNGVEEWWQNNKRHRADGPAVIYPDSSEIVPEYRGVKQFWDNGALTREDVPPNLVEYRNSLVDLRRRHGL